MEYLTAYLIMAVIIALLAIIYTRGVIPIQHTCDRFAAAYVEAYLLAVGKPPRQALATEPDNEGGATLLPTEKQPQLIADAFARGTLPRIRKLDAEMETALRDCFAAIGSSGRYRLHYYQPLSELYTIFHLYLTACDAPEEIKTANQLTDVETYLNDYPRLINELSRRLTSPGRTALHALHAQARTPKG